MGDRSVGGLVFRGWDGGWVTGGGGALREADAARTVDAGQSGG